MRARPRPAFAAVGEALQVAGDIAFVLAKDPADKNTATQTAAKKEKKKASPEAQALQKRTFNAEKTLDKLTKQMEAIEAAMLDKTGAPQMLANMTQDQLVKHRADIAKKLAAAEAEWMQVSEILETIDA